MNLFETCHFLQNLFLALSRLVKPSAALMPLLLAKYNISFLDAIGRAPRILPYEYFRTFKMMQDFIEFEFKDLPGSSLVNKGRYMISRLADNQALDAISWSRIIVPGSEVEMSMILLGIMGYDRCEVLDHMKHSKKRRLRVNRDRLFPTLEHLSANQSVRYPPRRAISLFAEYPSKLSPLTLENPTEAESVSHHHPRRAKSLPAYSREKYLMNRALDSQGYPGSTFGKASDLDTLSSTYDELLMVDHFNHPIDLEIPIEISSDFHKFS
ncbi:hypothetical protein B0O99DRAFT_598908 [Bisporella sp. PMI_857]|nr:hypothetical protein B0O99DRAFT_598908 [Bisporella sp. PMI_857]